MSRDEEDEPNVPRTISDDEIAHKRPDTGERRLIDADDIARAAVAGAAAAARAQDRETRLRSLELRNAEWFGYDGAGGKLESMETSLADHEKRIDEHSGKIDQLTEFKVRILWLGGLCVTIGGVIAALAFKIVDHYWK